MVPQWLWCVSWLGMNAGLASLDKILNFGIYTLPVDGVWLASGFWL